MSEFLFLMGSCAAGAAIGNIPSTVIYYRIRRELLALVDQQRLSDAAERALPPAGAGTGAMAAQQVRAELRRRTTGHWFGRW